MTNAKWPSATKDRPCPACSHTDNCKVAPDGTAAVCWRNGNKTIQCGRRLLSASPPGRRVPAVVAKAAVNSGGGFPTKEAAAESLVLGVRAKHDPGAKLARIFDYPRGFCVARYEWPGDKTVRPLHCDGGRWQAGDPEGLLPLYHGDDLPADGALYVTEGEKACEAARAIGFPATTSSHGSSSAGKSDWKPLAGRDVLIMPDNDKAGRKYALQVASILIALGCKVKILPLPDLPEGGDIVEFVGARDGQEADTIRRSIETLAIALPYVRAADVALNAAGEPWPDPLPLPAGLPPVLPFDFDLLPTALHRWIEDISQRMQCPPDYCAATAVIVAGALIGRKVAIRPKKHDDWQVVPNLYGVNVGRPSLMKTPAMKEMLKFLGRLEVGSRAEYAKATAEHEAAAMVADAKKKVRKEELKRAVKDGGDAQAIADAMAIESTDPPTRKRYLVNDTTVEKLGMILSENPNGVLLFVDELVSLLRSMEREGHEGDRGFYLTAWAGDSRYTYDRVGRGTLDIEASIVSIVGSIQPGVLADYLRGAVHGGGGDDGLIQRFQIAVFPDAPIGWVNVDTYPDADAKSAAHAALQRLSDLTPEAVRAELDNYDRDALPFLRFDALAQQSFDRWRLDLETRLRNGSEHPAIESHLAKYRSLIPSLALILHLLDGGVGPVGITATEKAIGWGRYLESHARRLYAGITEASAVAARALAARIEKGDVQSLFAPRDIYRNGWSGLDKDRTESAIDALLSICWLEERIEPTAGKNRTRYAINPKIEISLGSELTKPTEAPFVSNVSTDPQDIPDFSGWNRGAK